MPNIKFRASRRTLTSHAGLSIIGQCFEIAGVDSIDSRFPTTLGMRTSDVIKSYLGLLCLGMSDYDAVENFRRDKPFQQLLTLQKVPSAATLRQRLEKLAANDLQARTAIWSTTLLSLAEAELLAPLDQQARPQQPGDDRQRGDDRDDVDSEVADGGGRVGGDERCQHPAEDRRMRPHPIGRVQPPDQRVHPGPRGGRSNRGLPTHQLHVDVVLL